MQAHFIELDVVPSYWEDATVNGQEDKEGKIPLRYGIAWQPIIDLKVGMILNWPNDVEAKLNYKVCDQGNYWLLDQNKKRIARWKGDYVPDDLLCLNGHGYGDYISFDIEKMGFITNWKVPHIDWVFWEKIE